MIWFDGLTPEARDQWLQFLQALLTVSDPAGKPLNRATMLLYLHLLNKGSGGILPATAEMKTLLNVSQPTLWRAEKFLGEARLVEFGAGPAGRTYRILEYPGLVATAPAASRVDQLPPMAISTPPAVPVDAASPAKSPAMKWNRRPLDPNMQAWFLASPDNMRVYLLYGAEGFGRTLHQCAGLQPSNTNWVTHNPRSFDAPFTPAWTIPQFMGWYWDRVSTWRAKNNYGLSLPNWGRLSGCFKTLLASRTSEDVAHHVYIVTHSFEVIQFLLGRAGQGIILDEATLANNLVKAQIAIFIKHYGDPDRGKAWYAGVLAQMETAKEKANGQNSYT